MRVAILAFLLASASAHAQWVSPVEQSYGPYKAAALGGQPALVVSQQHVLLAWSEVDPITNLTEIRTGLLDFSGRLVTPTHALPQYGFGGTAWAPSVASDGNGFFVGWTEPVGAPAFIGMALDRDGKPIGQPRYAGRATAAATPVTGWSGTAYFSGADGFQTAFDRKGEPVVMSAAIPIGFRYSADGMLVGLTVTSNRPQRRCTFGFGYICWDEPGKFQLRWTLRRDGDGWTDFLIAPYYGYAVTAAGSDLNTAIVWRAETAPEAIRGVRVINGGLESSFKIQAHPLRMPMPESMAWDGERWLLVMTLENDVYGAFIDRTGGTFQPFAIANSARNESHAQVVALSRGRFLVAYDSDLPKDHRIARRIVTTTDPDRRRAVR
jgi:hypothetical protein